MYRQKSLPPKARHLEHDKIAPQLLLSHALIDRKNHPLPQFFRPHEHEKQCRHLLLKYVDATR